MIAKKASTRVSYGKLSSEGGHPQTEAIADAAETGYGTSLSYACMGFFFFGFLTRLEVNVMNMYVDFHDV